MHMWVNSSCDPAWAAWERAPCVLESIREGFPEEGAFELAGGGAGTQQKVQRERAEAQRGLHLLGCSPGSPCSPGGGWGPRTFLPVLRAAPGLASFLRSSCLRSSLGFREASLQPGFKVRDGHAPAWSDSPSLPGAVPSPRGRPSLAPIFGCLSARPCPLREGRAPLEAVVVSAPPAWDPADANCVPEEVPLYSGSPCCLLSDPSTIDSAHGKWRQAPQGRGEALATCRGWARAGGSP